MLNIKLDIIKKALEEKSAYDIEIEDVSSVTPFFTYYVICSVKNIRQANACIDEIKDKLERANIEFKDAKGQRNTEWSIIDLKDILVHVFTEEERKRIDLESIIKERKNDD